MKDESDTEVDGEVDCGIYEGDFVAGEVDGAGSNKTLRTLIKCMSKIKVS